MNIALLSAIIATVTSIAVVLLQEGLKALASKQQRATSINSEYLNPLRLYAEETFFRLHDIGERFAKGQKENLLFLEDIQHPQQFSQQGDDWFNGEGCYFASSCYFTACLFACIKKVREDIPYLKLGKANDTAFLCRIFVVSHSFLQELGIFYAIQHSIGSEMYVVQEKRLLTYREFCNRLKNSETRVWFDRLISFYLDINQGKRMLIIDQAMESLYHLSEFCDRAVQGSRSIDTRLKAEKKSIFSPKK
ncbi:MAG: hypothetical protein KTR27_01615 [Leptolyngbyaceae cyanobacterium MAG.088]|nr:hypothetical protein [Leptolyngbyaceae cyanobacterium MAG.088]